MNHYLRSGRTYKRRRHWHRVEELACQSKTRRWVSDSISPHLAKRTKKTAELNAPPPWERLSFGQALFLFTARVLGFHGQGLFTNALAQVGKLGPADFALPIDHHLLDAR